jgi:Ca2+-binding RTX toxin-like protein
MEKEHNFSRKKIKTVSQIIPTIPILHGQHKKPALVAVGIPSTILVIFASILTLTPTIGTAFAVTLSGTNGDDDLRGTNNPDTIYGKSGNDLIYGYGSDDKLYGGRGDDRIKGGTGNDYISGWYGGNTLYGGDGNDRIYSTAPPDPTSFPLNVIHGDRGNDYIKVDGQNAKIYGDDGADNIIAINGDEEVVHKTVYAGSGNDVVETDNTAYGEGGDDHLKGAVNAGLHGGDGDDTLEASSADHIYLTGGLGADHFDCGGYGQGDVTVRDFNPSEGDTKTNCPGL